jgi:hypothetical protein
MVQDQLVDYISSQVKLGVTDDAIKAALVGAGWAATDVEDTLKKVKAPATVQTTKPVASTGPANSFFAGSGSGVAAGAPKSAEPQTIRVSDLISSSATSSLAGNAAVNPAKVSPKGMAMNPSTSRDSAQTSPTPKEKAKSPIMMIVLVILIILFAGAAGYFFFQNTQLSASVGTVNTQSQSVTAQVSTLQAQVQALDASNTSMAAQVAALSASNQNLKTEISFFVAPLGNAAATTSIIVSGIISGGKPTFILTTVDGVKISIKNSADASVRSILQPLASSSQTTQIAGTYVPGSALVTVLTVNGASVNPPSSAATTASSTGASSTAASSTSGK